MGCGCGGKKNSRNAIRGVGPRPIVTPQTRSAQSGVPKSIAKLSALSNPTVEGSDRELRRKIIEKKRRDLIALRNTKKFI